MTFHSFRDDFYKIGLFCGLHTKQSLCGIRVGLLSGHENHSACIKASNGNQLRGWQKLAVAQLVGLE